MTIKTLSLSCFSLIFSMCVGCTPDYDYLNKNPQKKIQSVLAKRMESAENSEKLLFWGTTRGDISDDMLTQLTIAGVDITNSYDNFFLATGRKAQIIRVSKLPFVITLEGTTQKQTRSTFRQRR